MKAIKSLLLVLGAVVGAGPAFGSGLLIPSDSSVPPLAIQSLRVDATIDRQIATTHVEQVFINHTNRDLEARYVFPLPAGATIREFSMLIDGKKVKGELVEKEQARKVYESIVARMRDPGLLEYLGNNLFRVRVFPVRKKATQKIELTYSEKVPQHAGLVQYVYPLRTGQRASRTMQDFTVRVRIKSPIPIKSIYSPSHQEQLDVTRKGDHEAVVGLEAARYVLDRDFQMFYSVSKKDFGLDLACYRPDPGKPGYFMMLISPSSRVNADQRLPRDICFVFDTSGSMRGDKIEQARKALRHCIGKLHADDRFNLITFSTDVQLLAKRMLPAGKENLAKARAFIDKLEARGGTNIHDALQAAVALPAEKDRPRVIVFLTDGQPTIGERDDKSILAAAVPADAAKKSRIFVFGVGDDVNTHLLDKISGESGGVTEYVRPQEAIDLKVSQFFDKASYPVLSDLKLELPDEVQVTDVYPRKLGDLYRGGQLTVFGRYGKPGHVAVTLTGRLRKGTERFVYESAFVEKTAENGFIEPIWAQRKIGYLLDEIRLHGENAELVEEVKRLGMKYSIQTPYTSYLVLPEKEKRFAGRIIDRLGRLGRNRLRPAAARSAARPQMESTWRRPSRSDRAFKQSRKLGAGEAGIGAGRAPAGAMDEAASFAISDLRSKTGSSAVRLAKRLKDLKAGAARSQRELRAPVRLVGGRRFFRIGDVWVDERFTDETELVEIKFGSQAYFALVKHKELREALKLGQFVIAVLPSGKAVAVGETGKTQLTEKQLKDLLAAKPTTRPAGK